MINLFIPDAIKVADDIVKAASPAKLDVIAKNADINFSNKFKLVRIVSYLVRAKLIDPSVSEFVFYGIYRSDKLNLAGKIVLHKLAKRILGVAFA